MRGQQIAAQREGWVAENNPNRDMVMQADVVVAVKRIPPGLADLLRGSGKPVIWDPLDFWKQPDDAIGVESPDLARALVRPWLTRLRPAAIITPNRIMADDLAGMAAFVECIYHHFDPRLTPVSGGKTVVYEGDIRFPDHWGSLAAQQLEQVGWNFRIGQPGPDTGALFAVRGGAHGSWLARRWKSNVKSANAIALGVPLLAWPEDSYIETLIHGNAYWFTSDRELKRQIACLAAADPRIARLYADAVREKYSVAVAATHYERLFEKVLHSENCPAIS